MGGHRAWRAVMDASPTPFLLHSFSPSSQPLHPTLPPFPASVIPTVSPSFSSLVGPEHRKSSKHQILEAQLAILRFCAESWSCDASDRLGCNLPSLPITPHLPLPLPLPLLPPSIYPPLPSQAGGVKLLKIKGQRQVKAGRVTSGYFAIFWVAVM